MVGSIREGLSEFFQIPDGYEVVLGNGGASAFWDIACASLITRKAAFGTYGSFSSKFAKSAQSAPFLEEPEIFAGEPGTYRLPELTEYVDTYCWAHNETSTGVAAPIKRIAGTKEQGALTLIDATSGAGALPVDISQTDAYYSRRKKLSDPMADYGLPYSPPLQSNAPTASPKAWISGRTPLDSSVPFPDFGHREFPQGSDAQHAGSGNADHAGKPGSLAQRQRWLAWASARCARSASLLYQWAEKSDYASPFVNDRNARSNAWSHRYQRWHQCIPSGGGIARKRHCGHQRIP